MGRRVNPRCLYNSCFTFRFPIGEQESHRNPGVSLLSVYPNVTRAPFVTAIEVEIDAQPSGGRQQKKTGISAGFHGAVVITFGGLLLSHASRVLLVSDDEIIVKRFESLKKSSDSEMKSSFLPLVLALTTLVRLLL